MFRYFFTLARRSLTKQGIFPFINIAGLAVGLAVVLLICAMIFNEYSFDKSFDNGNRIYRFNSYLTKFQAGQTYCISSPAAGPTAKEGIPEVEAAVRTLPVPAVVKVGETLFKIDNLCWADEDFFRLFDRSFVYGSAETAISRPGTVAVCESKAKVLFGDRDPIGETVLVDNTNRLEVSAVYKDFPANSSFGDYQMVGSYKSSHHLWIKGDPNPMENWNSLTMETFCMLTPGADASVVETRMQGFLEEKFGTNGFYEIRLQPFQRIHLYSKGYQHSYTHEPGDVERIKLLSLLAGIILLVACINYMNLSTARAQKRSKEIGISKTLGAKRKDIIGRLYAETGMLTLIAFVVAFLLSRLLLPVFNNLTGQDIHIGIVFNPWFLTGVLSVYVLTTLIAASYPALYLSGFAPLTVIRQARSSKTGGHAMVRKVLTVVQFSVAIVLIAWVAVIRTQVNYISDKDLGYSANNVMGISLKNLPRNSDFKALKNDFTTQSSVSEAALSSAFPFDPEVGDVLFKTFEDQRRMQQEKTATENSVIFSVNRATPEIVDVLGMKLIAGTTFPERKQGDTVTYAVINRKAVEFLGTTPEEIIGKMIPSGKTCISGVVEDFNFRSLHEPIGAYGIFQTWNSAVQYLLVKVKGGNTSQQLAEYEKIFKKHFPNDLFEPLYPSLLLEKSYEADRQTNRMALIFSILAILVACMGVFGLTAFMAEQRTKEIGVRKVLGASVANIVSLFTDSYIRLLAISLVVALPLAWWIGNLYLQGFAYRISLQWWMLAVAALITIALTLFTVCIQAVKSATADPVKSIKTE